MWLFCLYEDSCYMYFSLPFHWYILAFLLSLSFFTCSLFPFPLSCVSISPLLSSPLLSSPSHLPLPLLIPLLSNSCPSFCLLSFSSSSPLPCPLSPSSSLSSPLLSSPLSSTLLVPLISSSSSSFLSSPLLSSPLLSSPLLSSPLLLPSPSPSPSPSSFCVESTTVEFVLLPLIRLVLIFLPPSRSSAEWMNFFNCLSEAHLHCTAPRPPQFVTCHLLWYKNRWMLKCDFMARRYWDQWWFPA